MKPGPRRKAEVAGTSRYKSTKPCPKGHLSERYTYNGWCVECAAISTQNRADKIAAAHAAQRANPEGYNACKRQKLNIAASGTSYPNQPGMRLGIVNAAGVQKQAALAAGTTITTIRPGSSVAGFAGDVIPVSTHSVTT